MSSAPSPEPHELRFEGYPPITTDNIREVCFGKGFVDITLRRPVLNKNMCSMIVMHVKYPDRTHEDAWEAYFKELPGVAGKRYISD